jgi:Do/DeqQ family serine protease
MLTKRTGFSISIILFVLLFSLTGFYLFASPMAEAETESTVPVKTLPQSKEEIYYSFSSVAKKSLPVVVEINTVEVVEQAGSGLSSPFDFFFGKPQDKGDGEKKEYERPGLGSGVIVKKDGKKIYILTNNHVAGNANEINVKLYDGREYEAKRIGNDPRTDLALVMFESDEDIPVAKLGNSNHLEVGDIVLAVGNPFGFESTVTMGIISALGRETISGSSISGFTDYIQTDASINPGNSGGALVNLKGEIVGINTWIASQSGGSVGVGFAIPINNAKKVIEDFISTGKVVYGWLGVSIGDADENMYPDIRKTLALGKKDGALILNVFKGSPAEKSGLMPGDFITSVNNNTISDSTHLTKIVGKLPPGKSSRFTLVREKNEITVNVKIEIRADETVVQKNRDMWPGIIVTTLTDKIKKELKLEKNITGVVIASVINESSAAIAGFKPGDVIEEINDIKIGSIGEFYSTLNNNKERKKIFQISRQGSSIVLGLIK